MQAANTNTLIEQYVEHYKMSQFLNDAMLNELRLFEFETYHNVYIAQDEQHYLYFLVEGQVQCSHYHQNGKLAVIALSNPFSAIGDLEIMGKEPVHSNVVATRPTTMLGISRGAVERYGRDDPRFLRFLIEQLRTKLYKTNTLQMSHLLPLISRLAAYLLAQPPVNETGAVILPDKEALASLLAATPRHLNRVLKELVGQNAISAGYPMVRLLDRHALQELSQQ